MVELGKTGTALWIAVALTIATGPVRAEAPRVLAIDRDVVESERFASGPDGPLQLLLRDGSTVTVGSGAALTIDRFVYDPTTHGARLAMTAGPGVFRVVGGSASKDAPVLLETPTAALEIRGGINLTTIAASTGETETEQAYGRDTVATSRSTGERRVLAKSGFALTIATGQPIAAGAIEPSHLATQLAALRGRSDVGGPGLVAPDSPTVRALADVNADRAAAAYAPILPPSVDRLDAVTTTTGRLVTDAAQAIATGKLAAGLTLTPTGAAGIFLVGRAGNAAPLGTVALSGTQTIALGADGSASPGAAALSFSLVGATTPGFFRVAPPGTFTSGLGLSGLSITSVTYFFQTVGSISILTNANGVLVGIGVFKR